MCINCPSDLKKILKFRSLEHFFLTVGQNNFGNKIPFLFNELAVSLLLFEFENLEIENRFLYKLE